MVRGQGAWLTDRGFGAKERRPSRGGRPAIQAPRWRTDVTFGVPLATILPGIHMAPPFSAGPMPLDPMGSVWDRATHTLAGALTGRNVKVSLD
jgi:hypothetical protein